VDGSDDRGLLLELALELRSAVLPELGSHAGRAMAGDGAGGDVTFAIDETAESVLEEFVASRAPRKAVFSEDRGLVAPPDAVDVLIVDPIDGTRPAMAGLESACVAVALLPLRDGSPAMGNVSEVRCRDRGGVAADRRDPRDARRVRAGGPRPGAQQLPL
jgi:myo-inositol-1(or 4)-monophosphatase